MHELRIIAPGLNLSTLKIIRVFIINSDMILHHIVYCILHQSPICDTRIYGGL